MNIVKPQFAGILAGSLHFGVCDVTIATGIASTAANNVCWRNWQGIDRPDKIHY